MMYLGFDIGKRWHDAALLDAHGEIVRQVRFAPTRAGLEALATWLAGVDPAAVEIGLEATGIYWLTLHAWLRQWGAPAAAIHVLNPLQTRAFRNANLRGVKSDRVDAVSAVRPARVGAKRSWRTTAPSASTSAASCHRLPMSSPRYIIARPP